MSARKRHWRVEVTWNDSTILHDGWQPIDAILRRRRVVRCTSVGLVLADDERGVVLAASVHGNEAAGIVMIPRGAIVRSRRLTP